MVDIQSKEVLDKIADELKIQPNLQIPRELAKQIQLTYEVNPKRIVTFNTSSTRNTSGTTIVITTPTDRDFFLTSLQLSTQFNATADNTLISMNAVLKGGPTRAIIRLQKLSLTAYTGITTREFNPPVLLERGSDISMGSTFTVGSGITGASIMGYTTDPQ